MFDLHPILEKDTSLVTELNLCRVLLMNDGRYPWLILVPQRKNIREIHHLSPADQKVLMEEVVQASTVIEEQFAPDKVNVGALGNLVPQLHIHIIARYKEDAAWPGPIWGHGEAVPYEPTRLDIIRHQLSEAFTTNE